MKIECKDCGVITWNRTERCNICKAEWRELNFHADGTPKTLEEVKAAKALIAAQKKKKKSLKKTNKKKRKKVIKQKSITANT